MDSPIAIQNGRDPRTLRLAQSPSALALGSYLILGGMAGLDSMLVAVPQLVQASPAGADSTAVALWTIAAALFAVVFVSGILLLLERKHAWRAAAVAVLPQSLMVASAQVGYVFSAGLFAGFLAENGSVQFISGWAVRAEIGTESARAFLGLNLAPAAIYLLAYFLRRFQRTRRE